jgi:dipeptidyl aminopeptidase/acylaminoacyl peptidase
MRLTAYAALSLILCTPAIVSGQARNSSRNGRLRIPKVVPAQPRAITIRDLALLRDIETLTISGDGKFVAFKMRQARIESNSYRTAWFVAATSGEGRCINVGDAGEPQMVFFADGRTAGEFHSKPAQWSPDSEWIAYIVKKGGAFQIWRSRRDGTTQEQLSHNPANVRDFIWSLDGARIYLSVEDRTREELQRAQQEEGRQGFLLDERFDPGEQQSKPALIGSNDPHRPLDSWESDAQIWVYDIPKHLERRPTASNLEELARIRGRNDLQYMRVADGSKSRIPATVAISKNHEYVAWLDLARPRENAIYPELKVIAANSRAGGVPVACAAEPCMGRIQHLWWSENGREVVFDRAEGVNHASHALYAWSFPGDRVRRILFTNDMLLECSITGTQLVCLHESPTTPRRVVAVSLKDGTLTTIVDPNPKFRNIRLGEVERLEWTNEFGHAAFGHFLKPLDYKTGEKYPLVVLTYRSLGFLRGGVGDEYPAHVLAANGFGVLSFDKPDPDEYLSPTQDVSESMRLLDRDLIGYRSVLASLEKGISLVEDSGLISPDRIGLTGLSYGAETVMFSLLYGHRRYAAAIVSSTSWDPIDFYIMDDASRSELTKMGRGLPEGPSAAWWRKVSPALNFDKIHTPILMNVADRELMWSIQTISTFKEHQKPLEVFVYPDEWHEKGWPSHRYAIYERNVDWLNFWLKGQEDPDPAKAEQYARWRGLRKLQEENMKRLASQPDNQ